MPKDRTKPLRSEPPQSAACLALSALGRALARRRRLTVPVALAALMLLQLPMARADECPSNEPFFNIPEIAAQTVTTKDGKDIRVLRGTVQLTDAQVFMMTRFPPPGQANGVKSGVPGAIYNCFPQTVRAFRLPESTLPAAAGQTLPDPYPGPTLRARVGDLVELTFVNQLDPARFGRTEEDGESGTTKGCDVAVGLYPVDGKGNKDTFPDCFHGSSTGNIHFHGTHTNPTGTGDNVLLELRPSPRNKDDNKPTIGPKTYEKEFDAFFAECEAHLAGNPLAEWPSNWYGPDDPSHPGGSSLGPWTQDGTWTYKQTHLLDSSDRDADEHVAMNGHWPQYYIGAYPYCFQIPYPATSNVPPPPGGLIMGQAPGTHWYHAHKHGSTAIDVANGMVGAVIIEGPSYDGALDKFYGDGWTRKQPVMVINQPGVTPNLMRGGGGVSSQDNGPDFVINGRFQSTIEMAPGEVQLWRIVNGSGRSGAFIKKFPDGFHVRQIAQDGVQFADENYQKSEDKERLLASGNRADLLVMAPTKPDLYRLMVQHDIDPDQLKGANPAIAVVLLQIRVRDEPPLKDNRSKFIPNAPEQPAFLGNITTAEANAPRTVIDPDCIPLHKDSKAPCGTADNPRVVRFASTGPPTGKPFSQHTIDGKKFDDPNDTKEIALNTVEEWQIENATIGISHPFHIHINPFQIVEMFDPNQQVQSTNGNGLVYEYASKEEIVDPKVQCEILPDGSKADTCATELIDDTTPRIWWDVFPIPSGRNMTFNINGQDQPILVPGHFRMRSRFVDFSGEYVMHCHILAHEDRGMMALVEVRAPNARSVVGMFHHH